MVTAARIRSLKGKRKISMLTAYDYLTARILEAASIDIILVGDSMGTTVLGYPTTIPVSMDIMVPHVAAVKRGAPHTMVVADMPFLSYGLSEEEAIRNAGRFLKEGNADAIKLEGGREIVPLIEKMVSLGIPVMGHIGLRPQQVLKVGYQIAGKNDKEIEELSEDAKILENAGIFSLVLEDTTEEAARLITDMLSIPTIGIGAGRYTDGQVLVITDMLGYNPEINYKHNKTYVNLYNTIFNAAVQYKEEVEKGLFPAEENVFHQK
ncbi:3-methyl-2-oxobutanoate hydroxymethyltransferase [Thermospira aquatica]|uniref:3-methyl-2-oxobutanoate hydroxymethyltransferase n=1 Tax=Thermospira aquatica TaxID=2828656 RepID=A0AAX3BGW2_9SPIR|nr:3-methyl-2-oxobutanoate hydroxymethyltransferase [Thermospira aquatica]URA10696.1 3-methyl-2-oxobutanoate hydroxymethyltransferase [Thermospira aquatica]